MTNQELFSFIEKSFENTQFKMELGFQGMWLFKSHDKNGIWRFFHLSIDNFTIDDLIWKVEIQKLDISTNSNIKLRDDRNHAIIEFTDFMSSIIRKAKINNLKKL